MDENQEVWQCLEVLRKGSDTLFSRDNAQQKAACLQRIARIAHPATILAVFQYSKSTNPVIAAEAADAVIALYQKLRSKSAFDETLRHVGIILADINWFSRQLPPEKYHCFLQIASFNGSGHVREEAVRELAKSKRDEAIPFLVFRLADWVKPVRDAAYAGFRQFLSSQYADALVDNLPLLEKLRRVERADLSPVYREVLSFLFGGETRTEVLKHYPRYRHSSRSILAQQLLRNGILREQEARLLSRDKYFLIRLSLAKNLDKLPESCKAQIIDRLLGDKMANVRLDTLYAVAGLAYPLDLHPFLFDKSAAVREYARYGLKDQVTDFSAIYRRAMLSGRPILGAMAGLSETGTRTDAALIEPYVRSGNLMIRKAALLGLIRLDDEKAFSYALEYLASAHGSLRRVAIAFLAGRAGDQVLAQARAIYATGNKELKKAMLTLYSRIGGWAVLGDFVEAATDEDATIQQSGWNYLRTWQSKAVNLFTRPGSEDLIRARNGYAAAHRKSWVPEQDKQRLWQAIALYLNE